MDLLDQDWGWVPDIFELIVAFLLAIWIRRVTGSSTLGWLVFWCYIIIGAVIELSLERHPLWLIIWPVAFPIYARLDIIEFLYTLWLRVKYISGQDFGETFSPKLGLRSLVELIWAFGAAFLVGFLENYRRFGPREHEDIATLAARGLIWVVLVGSVMIAALERSLLLGLFLGGAVGLGSGLGLLNTSFQAEHLSGQATPRDSAVLGAVVASTAISAALIGKSTSLLVRILRGRYAKESEAAGSFEELLAERQERKMEEAERRTQEEKIIRLQSELEEKDREKEEKEQRLRQIYSDYPGVAEQVPRILESLSEGMEYRGWQREIQKRFRDEQSRKSIKKQQELAAEARRLIEERAELERSRAVLARALYETAEEIKRIMVKEEWMKEGEVERRARLELDLETIRLETEKARLEEELRQIRGEGRPKQKSRADEWLEELEGYKTERTIKDEARFVDVESDLRSIEKLGRFKEEWLQKRFGDKDYEELTEAERREWGRIDAYFDRRIQEVIGGMG